MSEIWGAYFWEGLSFFFFGGGGGAYYRNFTVFHLNTRRFTQIIVEYSKIESFLVFQLFQMLLNIPIVAALKN